MAFQQDVWGYGTDELPDPPYQHDVAPSVPLQCNMFTASPALNEWASPYATSCIDYNFDFGSQMPIDLSAISSQPKLMDPWNAQALEEFWPLHQDSFPGNRDAASSRLKDLEFENNQSLDVLSQANTLHPPSRFPENPPFSHASVVNSLSSPFEHIFTELEFPNPIPEYRGGEWTNDYNISPVFPSEIGAHKITLPGNALDYSQLYQLPSVGPRQPFSPSCLLEQNQVPLTEFLNSSPGENQTFDTQRHPTQSPTLSSVIGRALKNVSTDGNHMSSITSIPSTHRELRPKRKSGSIEDSLVKSTVGDTPQLPRKAKKLKGSTCVSCRLARVTCGKNKHDSKCRSCRRHFHVSGLASRSASLEAPLTPEITFLNRAVLFELLNKLALSGTRDPRDPRDIAHGPTDMIVCHFELFLEGSSPNQLSNRSQPFAVRFAPDHGRAGIRQEVITAMKKFMDPAIDDILPPVLRGPNESGIILTALQCVSWYGILSSLENNRIFQTRNLDQLESRYCLLGILESLVIVIQELLESLMQQFNDSAEGRILPEEGLCALWVVNRFMEAHKTYLRNSSSKNVGNFHGIMNEFRQHIYDQTKMTLRTLQKFRQNYGAYFCTSNAVSEIERLVNLIDNQRELRPLLNITLERHVPSLWGILQPSLLEPRSFTQILNSESSSLEDYLELLACQIAGGSTTSSSTFSKANYCPPQKLENGLQLIELQKWFGNPDYLSVEFRRHSAREFSRRLPESLPSITFGTSATFNGPNPTIDSRSSSCSESALHFLEGTYINWWHEFDEHENYTVENLMMLDISK